MSTTPPKAGLISVASDHAGFLLKQEILKHLKTAGLPSEDLGCPSTESVDYPDYARKVAEAVSSGRAYRGILLCGSGIGMAMAANRFPGVRAAAVSDVESARLTRQHNDANVLCLGGRLTDSDKAVKILETFLNTPFEGGRHERRVKKMDDPTMKG